MRHLCWLVSLAGILWLAGCAGGISSLTGGSVPIGDIDGTVYQRFSPAEPLPDVEVELRDATGVLLETTRSDPYGNFTLSPTRPGDVQVIAIHGAYRARVGFRVMQGTHARVVLQLAAVNASISALAVVGPAPATNDQPIELQVGQHATFSVNGLAADGELVATDVPVSWALLGNIGNISPEGQLDVQRQGDGELVVQYGEISKRMRIQVKANATGGSAE